VNFAWILLNVFKPTLNILSLFKVLTKLKKMFILIIELNNIFKFNISKHTWWLLFIYSVRDISGIIYHGWTHLKDKKESIIVWIIIKTLEYSSLIAKFTCSKFDINQKGFWP